MYSSLPSILGRPARIDSPRAPAMLSLPIFGDREAAAYLQDSLIRRATTLLVREGYLARESLNPPRRRKPPSAIRTSLTDQATASARHRGASRLSLSSSRSAPCGLPDQASEFPSRGSRSQSQGSRLASCASQFLDHSSTFACPSSFHVGTSGNLFSPHDLTRYDSTVPGYASAFPPRASTSTPSASRRRG